MKHLNVSLFMGKLLSLLLNIRLAGNLAKDKHAGLFVQIVIEGDGFFVRLTPGAYTINNTAFVTYGFRSELVCL